MIPLKEQLKLARRHSGFMPSLIAGVMKQERPLVESQATPESRELYNMASSVYTEFRFLRCFIRLAVSTKGILSAKHTPEHRIEDMLVSHFSYRFPLFIIVLGSGRGTFIGKGGDVKRLDAPFESVVRTLESKMKENMMMKAASADDFSHETWEAFYKSQCAHPSGRRRVSQAVPKKYLKMESFSEERKALSGKTLSDFWSSP